MIEYRIESSEQAGKLEESVRLLLADGWLLSGSVAIAFCGWRGYGAASGTPMYYFAQALTREKKK